MKPYIICHMMASVDEVSLMAGPGIDGRKGMAAVFDGIDEPERPPHCSNYRPWSVWAIRFG